MSNRIGLSFRNEKNIIGCRLSGRNKTVAGLRIVCSLTKRKLHWSLVSSDKGLLVSLSLLQLGHEPSRVSQSFGPPDKPKTTETRDLHRVVPPVTHTVHRNGLVFWNFFCVSEVPDYLWNLWRFRVTHKVQKDPSTPWRKGEVRPKSLSLTTSPGPVFTLRPSPPVRISSLYPVTLQFLSKTFFFCQRIETGSGYFLRQPWEDTESHPPHSKIRRLWTTLYRPFGTRSRQSRVISSPTREGPEIRRTQGPWQGSCGGLSGTCTGDWGRNISVTFKWKNGGSEGERLGPKWVFMRDTGTSPERRGVDWIPIGHSWIYKVRDTFWPLCFT